MSEWGSTADLDFRDRNMSASEDYQRGFAFGSKQERQRIIKLLQKAIDNNGKDSWLDAIELIKGEK